MKHYLTPGLLPTGFVAPFVGAWIETGYGLVQWTPSTVAPFVGAWIETIRFLMHTQSHNVAPFVGAWIET